MKYSDGISDFRHEVGEKIKNIRISKGFTQKEVAKKARITFYTYCRIENNETISPNLATLYKITHALGVRFHEIF